VRVRAMYPVEGTRRQSICRSRRADTSRASADSHAMDFWRAPSPSSVRHLLFLQSRLRVRLPWLAWCGIPLQAFCNGEVPIGEGWPRYEVITQDLVERLAVYVQ
jgi:hypothetical protein